MRRLGSALGITANAVTKILGGSSTMQYAKLSNLADLLGADPNDILGFAPGAGRELLKGAIEGTLRALRYSSVEADEIAPIVLSVLDTFKSGSSPREKGRTIAEFLIRQHVDSKQQ
jgi:transcriptional regulator with XRE-family HTH domain